MNKYLAIVVWPFALLLFQGQAQAQQQSYPLVPWQCPSGQFANGFNPTAFGLPGFVCAQPAAIPPILIGPAITNPGDLAAWGNSNGTRLVDVPSQAYAQAANTTELKKICTGMTGCPTGNSVAPAGVWRITDGVAGAPPLFYCGTPTCSGAASSACSISGGDGGSQIPSSDGKCWYAQFPSTGADIREWGAPSDGTTNASAIINTAISSGVCPIIVPISTLNFSVQTAINDPAGCLEGVYINRNIINTTTNAFPGSSAIICSATVSPCVTEGPNSPTLETAAPGLSNLIVSRVAGTPNAGTIGVLWAGGRSPGTTNLFAYNHDDCLYWKQIETSAGAQGIYWTGYNVGAANCATHYTVFDGWAGARFFGGLFSDGQTVYTNISDFAYFTNTCTAGHSLCPEGPNTIEFNGTHFGLASPSGMACPFRWGGYVPTSDANYGAEVKLDHIHVEFFSTKYTGSASKGMLCSDGTVSQIDSLFINNSRLFDDSGGSSVTLFNLNSTTDLTHTFISYNDWGCSSISLTPSRSGGLIFFDFSHNTGCYGSGVSFVSSGGSNAIISDNKWLGGAITVGGAWGNLTFTGNQYTSVAADTATGPIIWSSPVLNSFTPVVTAGSTTITTSLAQGQLVRTSDGGFTATINIAVSNLNGATGSSPIAVSGIPYTCADGFERAPLSKYTNFAAGFTSVAMADVDSNSPADIDLITTAAGGQQSITASNLTNTSAFYVSLHCGTTQ